MRALTLTQPWATLVAIGAKRIETRSWYTSYRGPVAIHAAKGMTRDQEMLCFDDSFYTALFADGCFRHVGGMLCVSVPRGSIVAVADLVDVIDTSAVVDIRDQERAFGDYTFGRFAWFLGNVRRLKEPIPCKGALGLWTVPEDIAAQIRRTV